MASAIQHLSDCLKCPICQDILTKPKVLPCSHTFCESCLSQLHSIQALGDRISCALCREVNTLSNNNVSNFPTNQLAHSLAEDFKERSDKKAAADTTDGASAGASAAQRCTVCDVEYQGVATFYCQNCSQFLCDSCLEQHKRFKQNVFHELVNANDVVTGEVMVQQACPGHPRELQQFVCITCLVPICCRCHEVGHHDPKMHEIIGISEFEESNKAAIEFLQYKVEQKTAVVESHSSYVKEQIGVVRNVISQQKLEIENAFDVAAERLRQRKEELLEKCNTYEHSLCQDLEGIVECYDDFLENITAKVLVVKEEPTTQLEHQSLSERAARIVELENIIEGENLDASLPESIARRAELLSFQHSAESNGLNLGTIQVKGWELREEMSYEGGVACTAATPTGQLAIATKNGDIKLFSAEGQLLDTPPIVGIRGLGFLSDGSCVVRQANNTLAVYSPEWEEREAQFETMTKEEGGIGGISIDNHDHIYVDYKKGRKTQVFSPAGGQAVKEIPCEDYEPWRVSVIGSGTMLLTQSHSNSVRIIDDAGTKKHVITKEVGTHIHPSVCRDGTILLACMNHSKAVFSIERYTCNCEYVETLIVDQKIEKPNGKWCYLQEVTDGNIVLCTPDKLYFYNKLN